jgi:ATP-dependent RNA helicase DeaD
MNLETVYMSEKTKKHLMDKGYKKLTDVQLKVIPCATEGRDIIAQSQTGTGKTAAFLIPIIEKLGNNYENRKKPRALIMVPTRELAIQVGEEAKKLCIDSRIRVLSIFGGERIGDQLKKIRKGLDIVIGTPGRIMDHLFKKKSLNIKELLFFVLDEVDEMISQGFLEDIEEIIKETPEEKQTFLFSATMPDQVEIFAKK